MMKKLGYETNFQYTPKLVKALSEISWKQVALGEHHTAVLTDDRKVYTFGKGSDGQLGHGNDDDIYIPTLVQALKEIEIKKIECGATCTIALSTDGMVFIWGNRT